MSLQVKIVNSGTTAVAGIGAGVTRYYDHAAVAVERNATGGVGAIVIGTARTATTATFTAQVGQMSRAGAFNAFDI